MGCTEGYVMECLTAIVGTLALLLVNSIVKRHGKKRKCSMQNLARI